MPVISFSYRDFAALLGQDLGQQKVYEIIPMIGCDVARMEGDTVDLEFFPNRPDLYSVEGIARAMKAFLGICKNLPVYEVNDSNIDMTVEPEVADVRPFVVCGVIRGLRFEDNTVRSLMDLQEKLHLTVGRKRSKVAIGVHDLDCVKPPFTYKAVSPGSVSFVPLGMDEKLNLSEILEKHERGKEFASILEGHAKYPVIVDREGQVLSFPPIINGTLTQVTQSTKNLFLDVTGTDYAAISVVLNIISTALAERGGRLESVVLRYPRRAPFRTPSLLSKKKSLDPDYANRILGLKLAEKEMTECLHRMMYEVKHVDRMLEVGIPAFRADVLHEVDLVEDVAIGYSYNKLTGELPRAMTFGRELAGEFVSERARQVMVGLGYFEMMTFALTSPRKEQGMMGAPVQGATTILNPVTEDQTVLRSTIIPSLLELLTLNKHYDLPQKLFEVGDVVQDHRNRRHLCAVFIHSRANFTEAKSLAEAVLRELGMEGGYLTKPSERPGFIKGRCAAIVSEKNHSHMGWFGEVHPEVITRFDLAYPVAGLELDLDGW